MDPCKCYKKTAYDFIDGELKGKEKSDFEQHLVSCGSCRSCIQQLKSLKNRLASLPRIKTSEAFHLLLRERIRRELIRKQRYNPAYTFSRRFIPVVGAFAIVIGAFLIFDFPMPGKSQSGDRLPQSGLTESQPLDPDVLYVIDGLIDSGNIQEQTVNDIDLDSLKTVPREPARSIPVRTVSF